MFLEDNNLQDFIFGRRGVCVGFCRIQDFTDRRKIPKCIVGRCHRQKECKKIDKKGYFLPVDFVEGVDWEFPSFFSPVAFDEFSQVGKY